MKGEQTKTMNYGYECKNWSNAKKQLLAKKLMLLVDRKSYNIKPFCDNPYIEIDNLYNGVRIRKITYLSEEQVKELIEEADKIYFEIAKVN